MIAQHHDAITGTETQAVTNDYMTNLSLSTGSMSDSGSTLLRGLLRKAGAAPPTPTPAPLLWSDARTLDPGMLSLLGSPHPCGGGGGGGGAAPTNLSCMAWRQTAGCDPAGTREPQNDKSCDSPIPKGDSGFCECSAGVQRQREGCDHDELPPCREACHGVPPAPPAGSQCFGLHPMPASFNTSAVVLHNTLGWTITHTARLVVNRSDLVVLAANGSLVPSQLNPLPPFAPEATRAAGMSWFPEGTNALGFQSPHYAAGFSLYFTATLPPASLSTFFVTIDPARAVRGQKADFMSGVVDSASLRLQFNTSTGLLDRVSRVDGAASASVKQQLWQYTSGDKDGAYIFRPGYNRARAAPANRSSGSVDNELSAVAPTLRRSLHSRLACNITATWTYHRQPGAHGDTYAIWETAAASGASGSTFNVQVLTHQGSTNWHTAHGAIVSHGGQAPPTLSIHFDNNAQDTGTANLLCDAIQWKSGGTWQRAGPAPPAPAPAPAPGPGPGPPPPPSPPPTPGPGPSDVEQAPVSSSPPTSTLFLGPVVSELQQQITPDGHYGQT
jgi:hypothetical protein